MEAWAALGVACNVLQLIEQSFKVVRCIYQVAKDGDTKANNDLQSQSEVLSKFVTILQASHAVPQQHALPHNAADAQLLKVAVTCEEACTDLLSHLAKLGTASGPDWLRIVKVAARTLISQSKTQAFAETLQEQQRLLQTGALVRIR